MISTLHDKNVYHGSIKVIKSPYIGRKHGTDFGKGFYITTDRQQAIRFAKLRAKQNDVPFGYNNIFYFTNFDGLSIYEFNGTDKEWLNCIVGNRANIKYGYLAKPYQNYDVLIGKVADDDTRKYINFYLAGAYGKVGTEEAMRTVISFLHAERLRNQICFKSEKSWSWLKYVRSEQIWL